MAPGRPKGKQGTCWCEFDLSSSKVALHASSLCCIAAGGCWEVLTLRCPPPSSLFPFALFPCPPQSGCKHCYDTPFATRPAARAKPEEARYHNNLPPAPTFYPTAEEWQDPFAYLSKIAPEATKAGIALIRPPQGWEPPIQMLDQQTGQLRTDLQVRWLEG